MITLQLKKFKQVIETVDTVELETPSFYRIGKSFIKITDKGYLSVHNSDQTKMMDMGGLDIPNESLRMAFEFGEKITESEFNEAYCQLHNEMAAMQLSTALKATA